MCSNHTGPTFVSRTISPAGYNRLEVDVPRLKVGLLSRICGSARLPFIGRVCNDTWFTDQAGGPYGESMPPAPNQSRITVEPGKCGGRPCIRHMRIRVKDVLELLASGASEDEVLADYPDLEREDIRACLEYAAQYFDHPVFVG